MNIDAVRQEIADRLDTIDGLRCYPRWPSSPNFPAAIVTDDDPYVEPYMSFGGMYQVHLIVRVVVAQMPDIDRAVQTLDGFVIEQILDAVTTDTTLGALVQNIREVSVSGLRQIPIGGVDYVGHEIPFTVIVAHS